MTTGLDTTIRPSWTPCGPPKAALEASSANRAGDPEGTGVTVNLPIPDGQADTPSVPLASRPDSSLPVRPERMAAPILWLLPNASDGVNGRRFVANDRDPALPVAAAAEQASAPIA